MIEETEQYRYGQLSHEHLVEQLRQSRPLNIDGRRYGESANRLSLAIPALAEAFPDAQFIWLLRDGREVVSSGMQRGWFDTERVADTPWERHRLRGDRLGEISTAEWSNWSPFRRVSWLWRRTNEIIAEDLAALAPDRHMALRLEDLKEQLPNVAEFLEVPEIAWAVPRLNARSSNPDTGRGTINEVTTAFTSEDWTSDQADDFDVEAGAFMDHWYPTWRSEAPAPPAPEPQADSLQGVQVELAELRTLRGELAVVNAHAIRSDRREAEARARIQALNDEVLKSEQKRAAKQEVNVELRAKLKRSDERLAAARKRVEALEKQNSDARKQNSDARKQISRAQEQADIGARAQSALIDSTAGMKQLERAVVEEQQRGDRLNQQLRKSRAANKQVQAELKKAKADVTAVVHSQSFKLGHGLVRVGKAPLGGIRRLRGNQQAVRPAPKPNATQPQRTTPPTARKTVVPDPLLGFSDLDRLDPSTIADGALSSFQVTLPSGADATDRLHNAMRTLSPDGVGVMPLPRGFDSKQVVETLRSLSESYSIDFGHRSGLVHIELRHGVDATGFGATALDRMAALTEALAVAHKRVDQLERQLASEKQARKRQATEAQDSTQFRVGSAIVNAVNNPKSIVRLPGELRALQERRKAGPVAPPAASEIVVEPRLPLKVVSILDEFTHDCFAPEFDLRPLDRKNWQKDLDAADLVFVESAWRGNSATWNYTINRFEDRGDDVRSMLAAARQRNIPSVFWNKEDPVSFELFLPAAKAFDAILTTDANVVSDYVAAAGHDRVGAMAFAAQPVLHNPIGRLRGEAVASRLCFAGSWRGDKYLQRGNDFDTLLRPPLERGALDIYDRYAGGPDEERLGFPEPFKSAILGSLPYSEIVSAYRAYAAFLNVNSVQESPTMFSRRVFELLACGTPVISTPAQGIEEMLGDAVLTTNSPEKTTELVDWVLNETVERDRHAHRGYRLVHRTHSYEHRVDQLLDHVGIEVRRPRRRVTVICVSNRPDMLEHAMESFARQTYADKEFVFVANSNGFDHSMLQTVTQRIPGARAFSVDESATLGECLNEALRVSDGDYFAKFDDDDHYGDEYLADLMMTFAYSGAAVAGKQTYYAYVSGQERTVLRFPGKEFRHAPRVVGGTIVADRSLVDGINFESVIRGTDSLFLDAVKARGLKVFSADRFNFCQVRHIDPNQHTWAIDEEEFLRACEPVGPGFRANDVFL